MTIISEKKTKQVFGAVLGYRNSEKVEIFYSFEFLNTTPESLTPSFDLEFIENRKKLTDQLFQNQNYELIGFYLTIDNITDITSSNLYFSEMQKIMKYYMVVDPVCLVLGTNLDNRDELPIDFYVSQTSFFKKIPHKIEGNDSERITLDSVMKFSEKANKESATKQNLKAFKNALDVLRLNLKNILNAAEQMKYRNDLKFQAFLDDIISNFPTSNSDRMNRIMEDKNYENSIMNTLCSCTLNAVYAKNFDLINNLANSK